MSTATRTALLVLEVTTAVAALCSGTLLVLAPDGSLLGIDSAVLAGTPFRDWLTPGVLLTLLVGGGFLVAGAALWFGVRTARELSVVAGVGLVLFEAVELAWIGPHPLQAVFGIVGAAVVVLALRRGVDATGSRRSSCAGRHRRRHHGARPASGHSPEGARSRR